MFHNCLLKHKCNECLEIIEYIYPKTIEFIESSMDIEKVQSSNKILSVPYSSGREFCGIINYLKRNSNIYNELNITSSSLYQYDRRFSPFNEIEYDDINAEFHTDDLANSWIRFEFKNHKMCL